MLLIIAYIALGLFWHFNKGTYIWSTLPVVAFFGGWVVLFLSISLNRNNDDGARDLGATGEEVGIALQILLIFVVTGTTVLAHFI